MGQSASAPVTAQSPTRAEAQAKMTPEERLAALSLNRDGPARAGLALSSIASFDAAFQSDPKNLLASNILSKGDLYASITKRSVPIADQMVFNTSISLEGTPMTNQKSSGRCWLFSACNMLRISYARKYNLPSFELSQSYLFFYDSLSKANYFLENMLELAHEPLDSRTVQYLIANAENDGGQFSMLQALVETFGLVPQSVYPESFNSSNSGKIDALVTMKLREYALELRELFDESMRTLSARTDKSEAEKRAIAKQSARRHKEQCMSEVYRLLAIACGQPPKADEPFTWEYYDKSNKYHSLTCTPLEFYHKHSPLQIGSYVSIINDPRNDYGKSYTVERLGSVWGANKVVYVNAQADVLKTVAANMIKDDHPVWFGCDVGASSNTALGIMDTGLFDMEGAFGIKLGLTKAQRLETGDSQMTHAMLLTAVHLDNQGESVRWRIENSWSDQAGPFKGYFIMTTPWFDEYVYQIVAPRKYVPAHLLKALDAGEPISLPPWDPMGALA